MKKLFILCFIFFSSILLCAQPKKEIINILITPKAPLWQCKIGEDIVFEVQILRDNQIISNLPFNYKCYPEKFEKADTVSAIIKDKPYKIKSKGLNKPGFLTCEVWCNYEGKKYTSIANVAVAPNDIRPSDIMPTDFKEFWDKALSDARKIDLEPMITLLPERCTPTANVYHISYNNDIKGAKIYGILSIPKKQGKYPAILNVPGAGVRGYEGDTYLCDRGYISLTIGIHGIPVNLSDEVYASLSYSGLRRYWNINLENRDLFYYKRVYIGAVKAVDFIYSLPEFDGEHIAVTGSSQGGALSIIVAALDSRIKCYAAFYPALCDLTAYLDNRAGGWPAYFKWTNKDNPMIPIWKNTLLYFSVTNFARIVNSPGYISWGYNDLVCPPSSIYATYNIISAPKKFEICRDTGHWNYEEQWERKMLFIKDIFNKN